MGYIKVLKNKAYSSRYQTRFRRRREGKTDYYARKRLVFQEKDKYDAKKYRLCVRRTNRRIIAQIIFATLEGDKVMAAADSFELRRFGLNAGLTNYAAAYCTGLLCARRLLTERGLGDMYKGNNKVNGEYYSVCDKADGDKRPFKAHLDVGLIRTTTGNRVFGAMKGASDGGLHVPHSTKRFPGFHVIKAEIVTGKRGKVQEVEKAKHVFDAKEHADHIFGGHVQTYYETLKKENAQLFTKQFSGWEKALGGQKFADLYKKVHAAIRANPARVAKSGKAGTRAVVSTTTGYKVLKNSKGKQWIVYQKLTHEQRAERVQAKMQKIQMEAMGN